MIRWLAFLICLGAAAPAVAAPTVSETVNHYTVTGSSFAELRKAMADKGPKTYWGYTRWWIKWSGSCDVDLEITITMPRLAPDANLTPSERRIWERMVEALYRHEQMHAEHGRQAAAEILDAGCRNPRGIIRKWADRDRVLDRETRHGATQGVRLPD